jgi:hypothetical protein
LCAASVSVFLFGSFASDLNTPAFPKRKFFRSKVTCTPSNPPFFHGDGGHCGVPGQLERKCRINALQTWFPLLNRDEKEGRHWRDAIGRFVNVFDRIFATKDLVEPKVCHALSHAKRHQDGAASAIEDGAAAEGAGSRKKRQRKHKE